MLTSFPPELQCDSPGLRFSGGDGGGYEERLGALLKGVWLRALARELEYMVRGLGFSVV